MSIKKNKIPTVSDLLGLLNKKAPSDFAESWDNVGLIAGDVESKITGVVISVNLGPEALIEAQNKNANVIVCHHPPIFKAAYKISKQNYPFLFSAIQKNISVIALHTNFDLASEELNLKLCKNLACNYLGALAKRGDEDFPISIKLGKFITYVPENSLEQVRDAVFNAGAGNIGQYSKCSFAWEGEGTFLGSGQTTPKIGKPERFEKNPEKRLEVVFPLKSLTKIVEAAKKAHPYEEMAFDIIELKQPVKSIGYGFYADFHKKMIFHKVLESVKEIFQLKEVLVSGPGLDDPKLNVSRIAFSPGSGSAFVGAAIAKGVDLYICGEVGYHQMIEARAKKLTLMVLGHSYSERFFVETVLDWIENWKAENAFTLSKTQMVFEKIHQTL